MPWEYCGIALCSTLLSYNTVHYCGNPGKMNQCSRQRGLDWPMCHKTHNNCFKLSVSDNHCNTFTCQFFTVSLFYTTWAASTRLDNFAASLFHFLFMWSKKTSVWLLRNTSLSLLKVQEAHNNLAIFQGCNFGAFYLASELKNISFLPGVNPPLTAAFTLTIQYSTLETFQWPLVAIKYLIYYNNLFEKIWDQLENFALRLFRGSHGFNPGGGPAPLGPPLYFPDCRDPVALVDRGFDAATSAMWLKHGWNNDANEGSKSELNRFQSLGRWGGGRGGGGGAATSMIGCPSTQSSRQTPWHLVQLTIKVSVRLKPLPSPPSTHTHTQCSGWGLGMTGCSRNAVVSVWLLADLSVSLRCVWQRLTCRVTDWTQPRKWKRDQRFCFSFGISFMLEILEAPVGFSSQWLCSGICIF